jgi:coiled-coil domain-containing protein 12
MGDRKARLAALTAKAGRSKPVPAEEEPADNDDHQEEETKKTISFRNYAPTDNYLDKEEGAEESSSKRQRLDETKPPSSALEEALLEAKQEITTVSNNKNSVEVSAMAPKKINWDLKRDVRDKLAKLERRTQKAIVELLKERLEHEAAEQANSDDSDLD